MNILWILTQLVHVSSLRTNDDDINKKSISFSEPYDSIKYPYVVLIYAEEPDDGSYTTCTGTLITAMFVLTAGHCIPEYKSPEDIHKITIFKGNMMFNVYRKVKKLFLHPEYTSTETIRLINDIGMMKLEKSFDELKTYPVIYNGSTRRYNNNSEIECVIIEFGIKPNTSNTRSNTKGYMITSKTRYGPTACSRDKNEIVPQWKDIICTRNEIKTICPGDSGGPMFCYGYLTAITSTKLFYPNESICGGRTILTRHMFVKSYIKYIINTIKPAKVHHHQHDFNLGKIITYSKLNTVFIMICWFVTLI